MADENDQQEARPAGQPVESRQEPPAGAQQPAGEQPAAGEQPPAPSHQAPVEPAPASGRAWRGRARGMAARRPVQLLAAGVAGAIIGGGAVGLLDALDDHGDDRPMYVVRVDRGGPFGPGWRRWQGPEGEWDERGGFPPGWQGRPFRPGPELRKLPQEPQPVPSPTS
ncbi:MAG: hypothetical protein ACRDOO_03830 [Actinomadura sp.]